MTCRDYKNALKGMQRSFEKKYIMDEIDSLSEYIKFPLGHNRTNGAFTPKSTSKLRFAPHFSDRSSYGSSIPVLILRNPNNHYNHGVPNTFDYNHYVYSDYLVCSVTAIAHIIRY